MPAIPVVYPRSTAADRARRADVVFSDLDATDAWAREAIRWVAGTNDWMRDYAAADDGTYRFRPDAHATRQYTARAIVKAFAADEEPDPTVVFTDLDPSSPWYRYAAVAVAHGWMRRSPDGAFRPDDRVTTIVLHRALVLALGLRPAARALDRIHTASGTTFETPDNFGTTMLGLRLGLRYNFPSGSESKDVTPSDELRRAYVAYSLWRATTQPAYSISDLLEQYADVELPHLGPKKSAIVRWGVRFIGFPYYWGGEWGFEGGAQTQPGFDCSGLTWWLLRRNDGGWQVAPPRPYRGWRLPERSSADMARGTPDRLQVRPAPTRRHDVLRRRQRWRRGPRRYLHRERLLARLVEHTRRRHGDVGGRRLVPRPLHVRPASPPGLSASAPGLASAAIAASSRARSGSVSGRAARASGS